MLRSRSVTLNEQFLLFPDDSEAVCLTNLYLLWKSTQELFFKQTDFTLLLFFSTSIEMNCFFQKARLWVVQKDFQENFKNMKPEDKGGFGHIFKAQKTQTLRTYSVKRIHKEQISTPNQFAYLENEITALRLVQHNNSLKLYEVFEDSEHIFLVTEYLNGGTLQHSLNTKVKFTEEEVLGLARSLLEVIIFFNQFNIIHRDIKPSNIMFKQSKKGTRRVVKLIDYGLCADFTDHSESTLLKDKSGTACYMAPEIIGLNFLQKFYDQKVDVFSVGIILFEIFAGKNPFQTMDYQQSLFKNFNCLLDYSILRAEEKVV